MAIIYPDYSNLKTFIINLNDYIDNYKKQKPYLEELGLNPIRFSGINAIKNEHNNPLYKLKLPLAILTKALAWSAV